jgi:hypothetical protein
MIAVPVCRRHRRCCPSGTPTREELELPMNAPIRSLFVCSGLVMTLLFSAALWADPPSRVGRISLLDGSASFRPAVDDDWTAAIVNYPLTTGDGLRTQSGARAELQLASAAVRLGAGSDLSLMFLDDRAVQLYLVRGSMHVRLRELSAGESFEVETPRGSVALLEPGSYRIEVWTEGRTELTVRLGRAEMAVAGSSVIVRPDQSVSLTDRGFSDLAFRMAPAPDAWERWCLQRDERHDRITSAGCYVPTTLIGYEDLYEWGTWQRLPDYGLAWKPRGVPAGWAPYRFGHWAWIEPWGWTWIDDAPWGFAPFHYGRWVCLHGVWYWIPGTFIGRPVYAPALVVFIGGPGWRLGIPLGEGIGWFPLGPRENYVPPYRASDEYVLNLNGVRRVKNGRGEIRTSQYVNRAVRGAITVVNRRSFVRSEPVAGNAVKLREAEVDRAQAAGQYPATPIVPEDRAESTPVESPRRGPFVGSPPSSPQSGRVRQQAAGTARAHSGVRKLVQGPDGPMWIWVEVDEARDQ